GRLHKGCGAERLVRYSGARGGGDQRVHDRRDRHGRRRHLLRHRPAGAGAGRLGGPRRPARIVGRDALWSARVGDVAQAADGRGAVCRLRRDVHQGDSMNRLERTIGAVLRAGVIASSLALAVGLLLQFMNAPGAQVLLHAGILTLLATPVARVVVSIVGYLHARDWAFAALTGIVLLELLASAVASLVFNKRL